MLPLVDPIANGRCEVGATVTATIHDSAKTAKTAPAATSRRAAAATGRRASRAR